MKTFNYYEYNSKRFDRSAKAEQVRNFIFAFKDGKKWATAQEFASQLAECGAEVMGAMFLARTKRMYN